MHSQFKFSLTESQKCLQPPQAIQHLRNYDGGESGVERVSESNQSQLKVCTCEYHVWARMYSAIKTWWPMRRSRFSERR